MMISILTVAYNSELTIRRTIESVLKQTYSNIEYIIIDGLSEDNTVKIAESYKREFEKKGFRYQIVSETDKGMYDALNKGANLCNGELVGQINSDDWYEPNAVEIMADLYKKTHYDVAWGSIKINYRYGCIIKHAKIGRFWTTTNWCHPGMFSKREILLEFPYALESMYDDFDFITAVKCAGRKIVTTDDVISNFTFGEGGKSTGSGLEEAIKRIRITYHIYRKYGMSRFYLFHRCFLESFKFIMGLRM